LLDVQLAQAARFFLANQDGVGFELDVESQRAGMFDDFEAIAPDQRLSPADR
jgi:hypothetical protein